MRSPFPHPPSTRFAGCPASTREGRDCERSQRTTALLFFPRLRALPGPWLLLVVATCTFVAVRALELRHFF
jgi:hypothetical protein